MPQFTAEIRKLINFTEKLIKEPTVRDFYLKSPNRVAADWSLSENQFVTDQEGIFMRFVRDDDIWSSIISGDVEKFNLSIGKVLPKYVDPVSEKRSAVIALNNVLIVNDSAVVGQQVAVALSLVRAVVV